MRRSPYRAHVYVVKEDGEPALRQWALSGLVEDRFDRTPSYSQYIATLKDKVGFLFFLSLSELSGADSSWFLRL
jgi:hypothetical protein